MFAVNGNDIHTFFSCKRHYQFSARNQRFFIGERDRLFHIQRGEHRFKSAKTHHRNKNYIGFGNNTVNKRVFAEIQRRLLWQIGNFGGVCGIAQPRNERFIFFYLLAEQFRAGIGCKRDDRIFFGVSVHYAKHLPAYRTRAAEQCDFFHNTPYIL